MEESFQSLDTEQVQQVKIYKAAWAILGNYLGMAVGIHAKQKVV